MSTLFNNTPLHIPQKLKRGKFVMDLEDNRILYTFATINLLNGGYLE